MSLVWGLWGCVLRRYYMMGVPADGWAGHFPRYLHEDSPQAYGRIFECWRNTDWPRGGLG